MGVLDGLTTVSLTGLVTDLVGNPGNGYVRFDPPSAIVDSAGDTLGDAVSYHCGVSAGAFVAVSGQPPQILASDAAGISPQDFAYRITVALDVWRVTFYAPVYAGGQSGVTITLGQLYAQSAPVPNPGVAYVPLSQVGQPSGLATLDKDGLLPTTQLPAVAQPPVSYATDTWIGRPDGALATGATPAVCPPHSGIEWLMTGTIPWETVGGLLTVAPGTAGAAYGQLYLGDGNPVSHLRADFSWGSTGSTDSGSIALLIGSDSTLSLDNLGCHLVITRQNWAFTTRQNSGSLTPITGGSGSFVTELADDGTVYTVSVSIIGNTAFLVLPDHTPHVLTDPTIGAAISGAAIWEIDLPLATDRVPSYHRVQACTDLNSQIPVSTETDWVAAMVQLQQAQTWTSALGTAQAVQIGDYLGVAGLVLGGDTAVFRAGAGILETQAAVILAGIVEHTGSLISFFGAAPAARPTVSGSRGGNAALASLITAMATLGLITDGTTA